MVEGKGWGYEEGGRDKDKGFEKKGLLKGKNSITKKGSDPYSEFQRMVGGKKRDQGWG